MVRQIPPGWEYAQCWISLRLSIYKLDIRLNIYIHKYFLQLKENYEYLLLSFFLLFFAVKARSKQNGKNRSVTTKLACRAWLWNVKFFYSSILVLKIELAHSSIDDAGELEPFPIASFPIPIKRNWYFNKFQCLLHSKAKIFSSPTLTYNFTEWRKIMFPWITTLVHCDICLLWDNWYACNHFKVTNSVNSVNGMLR